MADTLNPIPTALPLPSFPHLFMPAIIYCIVLEFTDPN